MNVILDIETDDLNATKIHCIVTKNVDTGQVNLWKGDECYTSFPKFAKGVSKFIMHNGISFDAPTLNRLTGTKLNVSNVEDTLILSQLLFPTRKKHSLESWGENLGFKKIDFHDFSELTEEMITYCIRDVDITHRLWLKIKEEKYTKYRKAIDLEYRVRHIVDVQERNGFTLDVQKATCLQAELTDKASVIEEKLQEKYPPITQERVSEKTGKRLKDKIIVFNPSSRQQIASRLMEQGWKPDNFTPTGHPIVDEGTLKNVDIPEAQMIAEYLLLNKRTAQIKSWLELLEEDGKVHGKVLTLKAISGRMAHFGPNMAQVPAVYSPYGKQCRACWSSSSPDRVLVGCDASSLELRCLAHYMKDDDYTKEVVEGDIHTANQKAAGLATRDQAKTFIYAFIYGAGSAKIGSIVGGSATEGQNLIDNFLDSLPSLAELRSKVDNKARSGYIPGLDGRKLHVRHQHAAMNLLLQGAGAIICKQWVVFIDQLIKKHRLDVKLVASIHDEYQFDCRKDQAEQFGKLTREAMKLTEKELNVRCPLDSEYKVGLNWSETH
jgi:DNA polymerase I-like protein with 3'-5' exonuclease and polymerase domains